MLRSVWLIAVCFCLLAACEQPMVDDDLARANKAFADRNMPRAERLLERYLHDETDLAKRWPAWQLLIRAVNANAAQPRASLEYLTIMLEEYADSDSELAWILSQMGRNQELLGWHKEAIDSWASYIELADLAPQARVDGFRRLAVAQMALRQFDATENTLQQCLALPIADHDKIFCMIELADLNLARENYSEVDDICQQIMESDPGERIRGIAGFLRGDALEQMDRPEDALEQFRAIRDSYPNPQVIDNHIENITKKISENDKT